MEKENAQSSYITTMFPFDGGNEMVRNLSGDSGNPRESTSFERTSTIKETVSTLLKEGHQKDTNPETFKAALDAVRFEHQRLQNEFMSLMMLNEHVQQKLDALADNNVKLELDLEREENIL